MARPPGAAAATRTMNDYDATVLILPAARKADHAVNGAIA
jgi:hypothetical protein